MRPLVSLAFLSCALALASPAAIAHQTNAKGLKIVHPHAVEPKAGDASPLVISMKIQTKGKEGDRLLKAETPLSSEVRIVSGTDAPAIDIPTTGSLELSSKGPHIEVRAPKGPFVAYATFPMTLTFEKRGQVAIEVMIEEREGDETGHDTSTHDHK